MRTICIFNWKCFPQFSVIFIFFVLHFNILFSYFLIKTSKSASRKPVLSDWQGGQHGSGIFVPKRGVQGLNANEAFAENRIFSVLLFFWLERATFEYLSRNRTCPKRNPLTKLLKELAQQLPHHSWDLRGRKFWFAAKLQLWLSLSLSLALALPLVLPYSLLFSFFLTLPLLHFLFEL